MGERRMLRLTRIAVARRCDVEAIERASDLCMNEGVMCLEWNCRTIASATAGASRPTLPTQTRRSVLSPPTASRAWSSMAVDRRHGVER